MFFPLGVLVSPLRAARDFLLKTRSQPKKIKSNFVLAPDPLPFPAVPSTVYPCSMCGLELNPRNFSSNQLKRSNAVRKCVKCMQIFKELRPVINARCYNICAYCEKETSKLTKEHLIPQSCTKNKPRYQIKLVCEECNADRGNDIDYKPYLRVMKQCPILKWKTNSTETPRYTTKNIPAKVQAIVCALIEPCTVNNKLRFEKILQEFSSTKESDVYAKPSLYLHNH